MGLIALLLLGPNVWKTKPLCDYIDNLNLTKDYFDCSVVIERETSAFIIVYVYKGVASVVAINWYEIKQINVVLLVKTRRCAVIELV